MALSVQAAITLAAKPVTVPMVHGVPIAAITLVSKPIALISLV